ncbi:SUMF1/EgtB/PvdO family nonheme iron enzyme, partial [candidate division KSB1 bacterium]
TVTNPEGPETGEYRILRGGSWGGSLDLQTTMYRFQWNPRGTSDNMGFRCVREKAS